MKPLTYKQRLVRLIVESLGQRYDDTRLDCTSGAHPAWNRGFGQACIACARDIAAISNNPNLNPKQRIAALSDMAGNLHKVHGGEK